MSHCKGLFLLLYVVVEVSSDFCELKNNTFSCQVEMDEFRCELLYGITGFYCQFTQMCITIQVCLPWLTLDFLYLCV